MSIPVLLYSMYLSVYLNFFLQVTAWHLACIFNINWVGMRNFDVNFHRQRYSQSHKCILSYQDIKIFILKYTFIPLTITLICTCTYICRYDCIDIFMRSIVHILLPVIDTRILMYLPTWWMRLSTVLLSMRYSWNQNGCARSSILKFKFGTRDDREYAAFETVGMCILHSPAPFF